MPSAAVISARRIGTAQRRFCSAEPKESSGRDDAQALGVEAVVDPAPGQLLQVDVLLQQGGVAAAVLRRVAGQQPAVVEQQSLPAARPGRNVGAGTGPLARLRRGGQVLGEESREFGPERLDVGVKSQLHVCENNILHHCK
jgi:hypothetical protein